MFDRNTTAYWRKMKAVALAVFFLGACEGCEPSIVEPVYDACRNITGTQTEVPEGYFRDEGGNCWPKPKPSLHVFFESPKSPEVKPRGNILGSRFSDIILSMKSMSPADQQEIPLVALEISKRATNFFNKNLIGILLYGSSQWNPEYWDLDIMIVLESNDLTLRNLEFLKQTQKDFSNHTLDLQLIYQYEINNPDIFSLDAHGAFFSQILRRAIVLSGENPFLDMSVDGRIFVISLVTRIQRYVFQARQEYIGNGRHNKDKNPSYHKKHILRVMFDILFMNNEWIETWEIVPLFAKTFPSSLSISDLAVLDSSSDYIRDYMILYEKLYHLALEESAKLLE